MKKKKTCTRLCPVGATVTVMPNTDTRYTIPNAMEVSTSILNIRFSISFVHTRPTDRTSYRAFEAHERENEKRVLRRFACVVRMYLRRQRSDYSNASMSRVSSQLPFGRDPSDTVGHCRSLCLIASISYVKFACHTHTTQFTLCVLQHWKFIFDSTKFFSFSFCLFA